MSSLTSKLAQTPSFAVERLSAGEMKLANRSTSDATPPVSTRWIDHLSARVRPYVSLTRITKPVGVLLLYYPCIWSISMACYAHQASLTTSLFYIGFLGLGSFLMRSVGCTINDICDVDIDRAVERTRNRPLARGDITRRQALIFVAGQLVVGFLVLLRLNGYSVFLGVVSFPLVIAYPFMKRITYWPQAVLGLVYNWGAILGWSAVVGSVEWRICLPLHAGGFCWTLIYDTIYAHQDKVDDIKAGVRSTALLFGKYTRFILGLLSVPTVSLIAYAGTLNGQGVPFFLGLGLGATQLARVIWSTDFDNATSCSQGFVDCGWIGFWVATGAFIDHAAMIPGVMW